MHWSSQKCLEVQIIAANVVHNVSLRPLYHMVSVSRMFRRIDDDGSKQLSYEEFSKGIHDTGLDLDEEGYQTMFQLFDKDGSGSVSIDEFLFSVRVG